MSYPAATPHPTGPPGQQRRAIDVPGLVALIIGGVALLPALVIFLIGLFPSDLRMIWWLGLWLAPVLTLVGVVVLALGIAGIIVGARRRTRFVLSIVSVPLGIALIVPGVIVMMNVWWT